MATIAQNLSKAPSSLVWFWEFLKEELAPYPGRAALVTRMAVAATVVMILSMTFRLPYGAYGAIYALTISRENPRATVAAVKTILVSFTCSVLYVLIGALLFLEHPVLRLFWVIVTLFLMFYALSAMTNYTAAARFGYLLIITIPLWDEHTSAGFRVEYTLWAFGAIALASVITTLTELIFAEVKPGDNLVQSLAERLAATKSVLNCYIEGQSVDGRSEKHITSLAMVGTSRLRGDLERSGYAPRYAEQMGAAVGLTGRLVDLAANLTHLRFDISENDRQRMRRLAENIANIREDLLNGTTPRSANIDTGSSTKSPLLVEMEKTVALVGDVFTGSQFLSFHASPAGTDPPMTILVRDALFNPEHIKFGLKGCLAASLCYLFYSGKDWPGINTAITTCFLTALSTIGSSHEKQILRIAGAIVGGIVLGIGAQIFILPNLDSIAGFTFLFLAVTLVAAWISTSSPRLSYFGFQIAVAFYLLNLPEFKVQTSLVPARDRVIGIFLGLLMMWLVFDHLWGTPAVVQMKTTFISNLRLLAQFAREPLSKDLNTAMARSVALREMTNRNFDTVRALADGVLFEFGSSRAQGLAWRTRIREWQPQLRTLFLMRIALWKYRAQLPGFELPEPVRAAQQEFDYKSAKVLDDMADGFEGKASREKDNLEDSFEQLQETVRSCCSLEPQQLPRAQQTFLTLSRNIESLTISLSKEI